MLQPSWHWEGVELPSQIICTGDRSLVFLLLSASHLKFTCWKCSSLTTASATDGKWSLRTAVASCVPASEQQRKWICSWYCNLVGLDHEAQNLNRAERGDRIKSAVRICLWQIGGRTRLFHTEPHLCTVEDPESAALNGRDPVLLTVPGHPSPV